MAQSTVNERIKFLIDSLGLSVRAFSELVGERNSNVNNYVGDRQSMPPVGFLEKIINHIENINPMWLITGHGETFLSGHSATTQTGNFNQSGTSNKQTIKGNKGGVQANSGGQNTINNVELEDCRRDLEAAQREVEHLRGRLQDKEALLAAKDDTINLLRASYNRPN